MRDRGVVGTVSYEARPFGLHSAMPTATARRLCPQGSLLAVRMAHCVQVARQIRQIFLFSTPLVEPLCLDVRGCEGLFGLAPEIAQRLCGRSFREALLPAVERDIDILFVGNTQLAVQRVNARC